jgi:hypothetical protein
VLWVEASTRRVTFVEYTIRDWAGFLRGGMAYEGERVVDGIVFPTRLSARNEIGAEDALHVIDVDRVERDVAVAPVILMPDPTRAREKHPGP